MKYKYVISKSRDIAVNFSLEEYMLDHVKDDEYIFYVWNNSKSVLIGRNQNVYTECNIDAINKDGVKLIRRTSGGGAVYFDEGNFTYSFIAHSKNYDKTFNYKIIMNALELLGFDAKISGRNDILIDGKKISGNAFFNKGPKHLHHGTILYNVNISDMGKYLRVSKKKLESKGIKSVQSRVINLIEYLPTLQYNDITNAMYKTFCDVAGEKLPIITHEDITKENKNTVRYYEKHVSTEWVFGKNPEFNVRFEEQFNWGGIDVYLFVKNNRIKDCKIFTDSLFPDYFDKFNELLIGKDYSLTSITKVLSQLSDTEILNTSINEKIYNSNTIKQISENLSVLFAKHINGK